MPTRNAASPPNQQGTSLGYLPGLDGLRAISVLAVLAFHHYFIGGHEQGFAPGGFLGVEVFFVVSGYLITSLLLAERRETRTVSLKRFWMRRARRLLPALFTLLAVVVLYALLFLPDSINKLKADTLAALSYTSNWWLVISHQSYASEAGRPALLKHLWSLAIEEQFYLCWPPLLLLGYRRLGRARLLRWMLVVVLASSVAMAVLVRGSINSAYYSTGTRLSGLVLGSVMAFFFAPYQIRGHAGRGARVVLDAGGLFGMLVLLWSFRHYSFPNATTGDLSVFRGGFLLVDLATLLVIAAVVHPSSDGGTVLGWAPLRWIGVRSYSLYLWHYPIFCVTRPGLDVPLHGWPLLVLRLAASLSAAELSYRFVETPIRGGAIGRYLYRLRYEHGVRRQRAARRGTVVAVTTSLVVIALGAGLASAAGETPRIPGINTKAHAHDKGPSVDRKVLAAIKARNAQKRGGTGGTGATGPTGGSGGTGATIATTPHSTDALAQEILAVGDSVMLGAVDSLGDAIPGIFVDAKVSRQFRDATFVLQQYKTEGLLPPTIVVHMGTNGAFSDSELDALMAVVGPKRKVYFVNAREPRSWEAEVNQKLAADTPKFPNARLLNWHNYGGPHDNWFVKDGIHLSGVGARQYARFIREYIRAG